MLLIGARAQAVPAPVIHTREEYNNIPIGGKYWYNNHLETKTKTTSSLDPPRAELVATPTPAPTVYKNAPWLNPTPAPTQAPIVEPTPTPELGSSAEYPIVLFSKAQEDSVPNGKWVVDSRGIPWQQRWHVATFDVSALTSVAGVVQCFWSLGVSFSAFGKSSTAGAGQQPNQTPNQLRKNRPRCSQITSSLNWLCKSGIATGCCSNKTRHGVSRIWMNGLKSNKVHLAYLSYGS
jgi:hypothetical protein